MEVGNHHKPFASPKWKGILAAPEPKGQRKSPKGDAGIRVCLVSGRFSRKRWVTCGCRWNVATVKHERETRLLMCSRFPNFPTWPVAFYSLVG
jgi:hypothetical protein